MGLLDDAASGWEDWWHPKTVPTGAAYDPETLGSARAGAIGNLGGNLLALAQGGLSPETRAQLMLGIGHTPLTYQQSMLAGIEGRLHGAQAAEKEQEVASNKQWSDSVSAELTARAGGGGGQSAARGGGTGAPRVATGQPVAGDVGAYARTALAALKGPESGGNANLQNQYGYSGLYQIGTALANSAGLYEPAKDEAVSDAKGHAINAWRGTWNIPGFEPMSHQQFLANPAAQQAAGEKAMAHNWADIQRQGLDRYVGQTVGNVTITAPGLLQAAWLGGVGGLKSWLSGTGDPTDANKTPVSKWAALQAPGGTATDAGVAQPVPQGGGTGGQPAAPGGGAGGLDVTDAPRRRAVTLASMSPEQLTLMRSMSAKDARTYMLQQSAKIEPTRISPTTVESMHLDPRATWVWDTDGSPKKIQDAMFSRMTPEEVKAEGLNPRAKWGRDEHNKPVQIEAAMSEYLTPEEVAARPNLNPRMEYQRDEHNNIKQVGERPAELVSDPDEKVKAGFPATSVVYRKADGTYTQVFAGMKRWATPQEKTDAGYAPDAKLLIGPDGSVEERDKGTNPYAPLNDADAQGVLIKYAPQVRAKTIDPNSAEGLRYKAAYDLASKGSFVVVQQPDGTKRSVWRTQPVSFPRLGDAPEAPPGQQVENAPPLTESQGKASMLLHMQRTAEKNLDRLAAGGYAPTGWRDVLAYNTPQQWSNFIRTPEGRQFKQAQEVWAEAYLRTVSGAVFGQAEAEKAADKYFPRPGDDAQDIAQKARDRRAVQEGMEYVAGPGAKGPGGPTGAGRNLPEGVKAAQVVKQVSADLKSGKINRTQAQHTLDKYELGEFMPE